MSQISNLLELYNSSEDPASKQRFLTKIQRCLIKSQEFGDEKLQLISQIVEMVRWKILDNIFREFCQCLWIAHEIFGAIFQQSM